MADGKTHLKVALLADIGFGLLAIDLLQNGQVEAATGVAMGAVLGTLITPDYDINGTTITESAIRKYVPIVGDFWVADWFLYALWSKHRGFSHVVLWGTLTRLLYLVWRCWWWYCFAAGIAHLYLAAQLQIKVPFSLLTLVWMYVTWSVHDGLHILFDRKRRRKNVNSKSSRS